MVEPGNWRYPTGFHWLNPILIGRIHLDETVTLMVNTGAKVCGAHCRLTNISFYTGLHHQTPWGYDGINQKNFNLCQGVPDTSLDTSLITGVTGQDEKRLLLKETYT